MRKLESKNTTKVFVLSIKNSIREKKIKKRLKFLGIKCKFFYAIDGRVSSNYQILKKIYNRKKCIKWSGNDLTYPQISNAEAHLRMYKYIIKQNISKAIIMEDDCVPSKLLIEWSNIKTDFSKKKYDVIQLFHSFGLVYKEPEVLSDKFNLYKACFNIPYATCYQITISACKYIVKKNKKIFSVSDWPVIFSKSALKQYVLLPRIAFLSNDHEKTSYQEKKWKNQNILKNLKKFIPFYNFLTAAYFIFHIPFIFGINRNYSYFKNNFLIRKIFYLKNLFCRKYIDIGNI